jgi:hypothetical protein
VLVCELVSHPFASMWICDDGSYILTAHKLATTGHIVYVGWAAAMLVWQLYLGAAFIKLFGFSFTAVRSCTVLVAMALAFLLQRTLVRANITERNAAIGTLALVLSPLYLMLSVTFMTDIHGLFAIVLCLYGCLRALQAATSRAAIGWLCFAIATNAICGTSRQIAWLGILVMVPSTLWLLRAQRRVLVAGAAATLAGVLFIFGCMRWFQQQPYSIPSLPQHLTVSTFPIFRTLAQFNHAFLDIPLLLLPIAALFLPEIRKSRPRVIAIVSGLLLGYILLALHPNLFHRIFLLEPTMGDWVDSYGVYEAISQGTPPLFLQTSVQVLLTIISIGGLLGLLVSFLRSRKTSPAVGSSTGISWKQLGVLLAPFTIAYIVLLIPSSTTLGIFDRYLLALLVIALVCLVRYYQDRVQPRLPLASNFLVGIVAIYGIAFTHNTFALYRARVAIAAEIRAAGVPDTSVDNGWEYNLGVELQHADSINYAANLLPNHAYVSIPAPSDGICTMEWHDFTPHIQPLYSISFDPDACYGPAPFAPVTYSRWLASNPGTLYVVRYTPPARP